MHWRESLIELGKLKREQKGGDSSASDIRPEQTVSGPVIAAPTSDPESAAKPFVYTYFSPNAGTPLDEQKLLITLWEQSWRKHGWEPVIIPDDGSTNYLLDGLMRLPSRNPPAYERACWARWVEMTSRCGLLTDYDVLNLGFTPADLPKGDKLRLFCGHVPCMVYGTKEQYAGIIDKFLSTEPISDHWSDMVALEHLHEHYDTGEECIEHGKFGWQLAKAVHFSHAACRPKLRSEVISEAEQEQSMLDKLTNKLGAEAVAADLSAIIPPEKPTRVSQLRELITGIDKWVKEGGKTADQVVRDELRKAGLMRAAKKRGPRPDQFKRLMKRVKAK